MMGARDKKTDLGKEFLTLMSVCHTVVPEKVTKSGIKFPFQTFIMSLDFFDTSTICNFLLLLTLTSFRVRMGKSSSTPRVQTRKRLWKELSSLVTLLSAKPRIR